MLETQTMDLPEGTLAWREFGDRRGRLLLFFHGWPGSSAQAWLLHDAARQHGFRGIAIDRPGIGGSKFRQRCLSDWPALVQAFAQSLGEKRFAVLGISGGGPYALACAAAIPDALTAAFVVCGAPPIAELPDHRRLHPAYRFLLRVFRDHPQWVRHIFSKARPLMMWPDAFRFFPPLRILLPGPDARAIEDPDHFAGVFGCQRDAFTDVDGLYADAALYAERWGFRLEDIEYPVHFWHGHDDANFHWSLAEEMAGRVRGANLQIVENEGHFSLPINQADAILAAMAQVC